MSKNVVTTLPRHFRRNTRQAFGCIWPPANWWPGGRSHNNQQTAGRQLARCATRENKYKG